jgi:magnesium chelatase family protein
MPDEFVGPPGEASAAVRVRVVAAVKRQRARRVLNRDLKPADLAALSWASDATALLNRSVESQALTARGWNRVRRVAVTVADLAESAVIAEPHVAEALTLRADI